MLTLAIYILMPVVALVAGVKIYMYRQDHNPPYFHAKYSGKEEVFNLEGETMKGSIGEKKRKKIRKWAKENKDLLQDKWDQYNP